ncbi:MAG TPA: MFS transporter [Longimicrobiales bacterium]|jgi:MFS family permease
MPTRPEGRRASLRSLLRGNVGALALISLLNDAASEMIYPLLPLFLTGVLGAGPALLGLIEGVAESTASLAKLAGGVISDRIGRRKGLVGWGYGIAAFVRPAIAVVTAPWHVLLVRFADRVGKGIRTAPRDALIVESVPEDRRGAAFGLHRAADHLGSVLGPLVAAAILVALPGRLRLVFGLALIPGVLSLLVWWRGVTETGAGRSAPAAAAASPAGDRPPPQDTRPFAAYVTVVVLFTLGNASDAFLLLRASDLGVPMAAIPLLWGLLHVSKTVWSVPGGLVADALGPKPVIALGWLLYAAVYAGFAVATSAVHIWILFAVYGLFFGLTEAPEKALVARLAPVHARGRAFGIFHAAVGFAALPSSLIFGMVWQVWGAANAFYMGACLALAAAVSLPSFVRETALTPSGLR